MTNDAISRSAVLAHARLDTVPTYGNPYGANAVVDVEDIEKIPALDVAPVVHSHWVGWEYDGYADGSPVFDSWVCNECGADFRSEGEPPAFNYCPNCGARMDGEENAAD